MTHHCEEKTKKSKEMYFKRFFAIATVFASFINVINAQTVQTIRGTVTDVASGETIPTATIYIEDNKQLGTTSDADGNFIIKGVPVGRHTLRATFVGYEPVVIKEMLVSSGKELVINIEMTEMPTQLDEVVVTPTVNKQEPLNQMAPVGARMFSVEESSRYAGGVSDPGRVASSFAGVATTGASNGISIHGAAPQMMLWRIEGIEVQNPNHFAEITGAGGGVFSSLSGLVLGNSDFMTGACPAEYGNAISGVFDMKMRNGNNTKYEHAFQVGTLGLDFASEGPFRKGGKGSYLVNYRYSTMGLATKAKFLNLSGETMDYQDLNFKLNMPIDNIGTFQVWGTGLIDKYTSATCDIEDWESIFDMNSSRADQYMGVIGANHKILINNGGQLKTSVAYSYNNDKLISYDYDSVSNKSLNLEGNSSNSVIIFDIFHQHKFSARYTMQNGANHQHFNFDSHMSRCIETYGPMRQIYHADGDASITRLFTNHKVSFGGKLSMIAGVNAMYFSINKEWNIEPRLSFSYKTSERGTLSVAYGMHSRKERNEAYFVEADGELVNSNLGLTKSHHAMLTYSCRLTENSLLKVEPFFQYLYDVPVEEGTSFSIINNQNFYIDKKLTNDGKGRNYGIDLTLERYLKDGYYGMLTATLYKSDYKDAQGEWHGTCFNRNYILNILGGKEWMVGQGNKNVFGINGRVTFQGGDRYTPFIEGVSYEEIVARPDHDAPCDETRPFEGQMETNFNYAFSIKYTVNKEKVAHHFVIEFLHLHGFQGHSYSVKTHEMEPYYMNMNFPNIAYRIEF